MRISALSKQAGLPVGTVKFYLRSGLLPAGRATSPTQAQYDHAHLRRLRLIRALLEVGHLPLCEIQRVLDAIDLPTRDPQVSVALVHSALAPAVEGAVDLAEARGVVDVLGWQVDDDSSALPHLARALAAIHAIGVEVPLERLRVYADAATHSARNDQATVESAAPDDQAVVAASAVLFDALLVALRRLAAEHQLARSRDHLVPAPRLSLPGA